MLEKFKKEWPEMARLALPIVISQAGQMLMGLVDTFMVGKLGPVAIGSVALSSALFFVVIVPGFGLLSALDHFISSSLGRNDESETRRWRLQGLYLALLVGVPCTFLYWLLSVNLSFFGIPEATAAGAREFMPIMGLSGIPFLIFFALRQYLQSIGRSKIVTAVVIGANVSNLIMNWIFIYGKLGAPAMGISGSALSTLINRIIMAAILSYVAFYKAPGDSWKIDWSYIGKLFRLGLPASLQFLFEVGLFSLSTTLVSRLDPVSLAAHSIVLNIASFTFMAPLGLSMASAIKVAFRYGEKNYRESFIVGNVALWIAVIYMTCSGIILAFAGKSIISVFVTDTDVIQLASKIIFIAALFQVADGTQVVLTGNLRGLGITQMPAVLNFIGYWLIGLPVGYYLCFYTQYKVLGMWCGLFAGLFVIAVTLYYYWKKEEKRWLSRV